MPHDTDDLICPKCGIATTEGPQQTTTCPKCGARGDWNHWHGSTDQGYYDGPVEWCRIGWVPSSAGAPLPHILVVGWYDSEDVRIMRHDGHDWTQPDGTPTPAPLHWCALPTDPET